MRSNCKAIQVFKGIKSLVLPVKLQNYHIKQCIHNIKMEFFRCFDDWKQVTEYVVNCQTMMIIQTLKDTDLKKSSIGPVSKPIENASVEQSRRSGSSVFQAFG